MQKTSYIILGYVSKESAAEVPFCALSWLSNETHSPIVTIHLHANWQRMIPDQHSDYISALIRDWSQHSIDDPNALICTLRELSVGPVRTVKVGTTTRAALQTIVNKYLKPESPVRAWRSPLA